MNDAEQQPTEQDVLLASIERPIQGFDAYDLERCTVNVRAMVLAAAAQALRESQGEANRLRRILDYIASDATVSVPEGCPEPWRSTILHWVDAANEALK